MYATLAAAALLIARRPDAFYRPQFWAEDMLFLIGAEKQGLASLFVPQAGYLHLIPRLVAWVASFFDPCLQPGLFLAGWCAVTLAVIWSSLSARLDLPLRLGLAGSVVLLPATGEVFFNLTNVQWVAALGLLLTGFKRDPDNRRGWISDIAWLILAGLTGPFVLFALPVFVVRLGQRRTTSSAVLLGVVTVASAIQGWYVAHAAPISGFAEPFNPVRLATTVALRWPGHVFLGAFLAGAKPSTMIACGGVILAFLFAVVVQLPARRAQAALLTAAALLVLIASTWRVRFDLWGVGDLANGDRYFFVPNVLILWVTVLCLAEHRRRWIRGLLAALLLSSLLCNLPRFHFEPYHDFHWYEACPDIRAGREVHITVNPSWTFKYRRGSAESNGPL